MRVKFRHAALAGILSAAMIVMTACSGTGSTGSTTTSGTTTSTTTESTGATSDTAGTTLASDGDSSTSTVELTSEMATFKDSDEYTDWTSGTYTTITGNGDSVTVTGSGVTYSGCDLTITEPGTYVFSGTINEGSVTVSAVDTAKVRIVLGGVTITNSDGPVINSQSADKLTISLENGTTNTLTDGKTYTDETLTAAIYSKTDLVFNGTGTLTVNANSNNAIQSKDDLRIISGTYIVNSVDDAFIGKDRLEIKDGTFTVTCGGDAFKSTNTEDTSLGYIYIANGSFTVTCDDDGFQSETATLIEDGTFDITAGGGAAASTAHSGTTGGSGRNQGTTVTSTAETDASAAKGIVTGGTLTINGGDFTLDTSDDAIHSNDEVDINGGTFRISAGDDAIHADAVLTISDGTITVSKCYEGLESALITINGGNISVTASDDGINAAGGTTTQSTTGMGGMQGTSSGDLVINGGTIYVNASGDGLDANGSITQTGGDVVVDGPTDSGNGALDYDSTYNMTGGSVLAIGSSGMLQTISDSSTLKCLTVIYSQSQAAGTVITLKDSSGNTVFTCTAAKTFNSFVYADAGLKEGETYSVYSGSTQLCTVTLSGTVTTIDDSGNTTTAGNGMGGGNMGGGNMGGGKGTRG